MRNIIQIDTWFLITPAAIPPEHTCNSAWFWSAAYCKYSRISSWYDDSILYKRRWTLEATRERVHVSRKSLYVYLFILTLCGLSTTWLAIKHLTTLTVVNCLRQVKTCDVEYSML